MNQEEIDKKLYYLRGQLDGARRVDDRARINALTSEINELRNTAPDDDDDFDADNTAEFGQPVSEQDEGQQNQTNQSLDQIRADQERARQEQLQQAETEAERQSAPPEAAQPERRSVDGVSQPQEPNPDQSNDGNPSGPKAGNETQSAQKTRDVAEKLKNQALKDAWAGLKSNLTKEALTTFLKAFFTNPYVLVILGLILAIGIAIGIFAYYFSAAKSGANGATPLQAVSPADNKDLLQKVQLLSGNKDVQKQVSQNILSNIQKDLSALQKQTSDSSIAARITTILSNISNDLSSSTITSEQIQNDIINPTKDVLNDLGNSAVPQIQGQLPIKDTANIAGFNSEPHNGTEVNPAQNNEPINHGTYIYYNQNKCDAVDLYLNSNSDIYPVVDGATIVDISDDGSGLANAKKIVLKKDKYVFLYAFIEPSADAKSLFNKTISKNIALGKTINNSLHLEMVYDGACVKTTAIDKIDKEGSAPKYQTWGEYMWAHIKNKLKLS